MAKVFHVLTPEEKEKYINNNIYEPLSLGNVGFIHLSKADQIQSVISNFYIQESQLILWRISESVLEDKLVYEPPLEAPNSGVKFPHYYKNLDISLVEKTFTIDKINDVFILPDDLLE